MALPTPLELPILPTPRERALLVLMNPDATIQGFTAVVEGDPSLTAAVLRAANSAASWPARPVRAASEGIVRLGTSAVKQLITTTLVRSQFATIEAAGIDAEEMWRHLLGCALLCEAQAAADDEQGRETSFTVGLLHDLGRLAMAAQAPTRYRQVVAAVRDGADARQVERHLFGVDHAEFGQQICRRWGLPEEVTLAVGYHHPHPLQDRAVPAEAGPYLARLALARALVKSMGIGDGVAAPQGQDHSVEEHPAIMELGGRAEVLHAIRWFRESTHGRTRPRPDQGRA